jgi:8-oxo-dGTP pyrophosphatase MutT (NUDIX family)
LPDDLGRRLDGVHDELIDPAPLRHAAVLCPLQLDGRHAERPRMVLIERSSALRHHAGQIAFPGGKPEEGDRDLVETALREASEEVGLERSDARILGRLAPVPTPTGFMIIPFVARIREDWEPGATSGEVARVLTPTLHDLVAPGVHSVQGRREWRGRTYTLHQFAIADPPLWGATARMVWDLLQRVRGRTVDED